MRVKPIGEVIPAQHHLSSEHIVGWIVILHRYPSGRKLPAPRLILMDEVVAHAFTSPMRAMAALNAWRDDPTSVRTYPYDTRLEGPVLVTEQPVTSRDKVVLDVNRAMNYEGEHGKPARDVRRAARLARATPEEASSVPTEWFVPVQTSKRAPAHLRWFVAVVEACDPEGALREVRRLFPRKARLQPLRQCPVLPRVLEYA